MSIFDTLFGQRTQQPQQPQQPQQQQAPNVNGNAPLPQQQHVQNNPQVPNENNVPPQNGNETPVDKFKDLFTIDPNQSQPEAPLFNLDPEKFKNVVNSQNFANSVKQEDVAALKEALGGNDAATSAVMRMMNTMVQNGFGQSVQASAKLTESGVQHTRESLTRDLPNHFKRQAAQDEIFTTYPSLQDEAIRPLVGTIQQLVQSKNPNATATDVNQMVYQYFTEKLPGAFGVQTQKIPQKEAPTPATGDFSSWLSS